jgi:hypothetical protein
LKKENPNKNFNFTFFKKEVIAENFEKIRMELTSEMNHKEIMKKFHKILYNSVIPSVIYDQNSPDFWVYRVTTVFDGFDKNNPQCYSYNPKPRENGRAHISNFPVFYGAINPSTAISEMKGKLDNGQVFYLSKWKIRFKSSIPVHSIVVNSKTIKPEHLLSTIAYPIYNKLKKMFNNIPKEYLDGFMYSIEKMGDLFSTPSNSLYHITSAYSHEIMYEGKSKGLKIPIILYPSVSNNLDGVNWAIHPDFVDSQNMELFDIKKVFIEENNLEKKEQSVRISILEKAEIIDGAISCWKKPNFKIKEIQYTKIQIQLNNEDILEGEELFNTKIEDTNYTIKDLVEFSFKENKIEENLFKIKGEEDETIFEINEKELENGILMEYEKVYKIMTEKGIHSIKRIFVPFTWLKNFEK